MSPASPAAELVRELGLELDGPLRWGARPTTRTAGIFVVESPTAWDTVPLDIDAVRRWLERVPGLRMDGERPTQTTLADRLRSFWLPGQTLLYVGRTSGSLSARVASLYATELGQSRPHPGGYWLKTLLDQPKLRLWWAETDAPEEYEDELLNAFAEALTDEVRSRLPEGAPPLPWANLESPTGPARATGLSGALASTEAATERTPSNVKRSDGLGRKRRPSAASGPAAAPRPSSARSSTANDAGAAPSKRESPTHVTAEGLQAMEQDLERLRTVDRPAVVERVKHARELGDLRENADYEAARNEQSFLEGRIQALEQQVRTAVVIESRSGGSIAMGSTVVYEVDGQRDELTIVGSTESDPAGGRISAASPVGKALLGHRSGDQVVVVTPAARLTYRVVEVR